MGPFSSDLSRRPTILTVPGLNGSGPSHWQTLWEQSRPDTMRIELGMWNTPHRNSWVTKIDQAIASARAPVILVGHSLGCIAIAWWAALSPQPYGWPVAGALLVAPADVDHSEAPHEIAGFAPAPKTPLPFPSIVVASSDDPWVATDRAHSIATDWGSHFIDFGAHGHINAASGLDRWPDGQELLERVIDAASMARRHDDETVERHSYHRRGDEKHREYDPPPGITPSIFTDPDTTGSDRSLHHVPSLIRLLERSRLPYSDSDRP